MAQMLHMGTRRGERLINVHFEAWEYGPVMPVLYEVLQGYAGLPVRDFFPFFGRAGDGTPADNTLREVAESLGGRSSLDLLRMTQKRGGAWDRTYVPHKRIRISDKDIIGEFNAFCLFEDEKPVEIVGTAAAKAAA